MHRLPPGHDRRGKHPSRANGFTLLEVLVALIIFSIAFGVIASLFQTSLQQSRRAQSLLDATAFAEGQISRFGAELPLLVGQSSGRSPDGLSWNASVDLATPPRESGEIALYRITLDVGSADGARHYVTLTTLRIGRSQ
ncbi:MAG: type IV pilus modification PilV family protein [Geminicoccaceae bacterium]